VEKLVILVVDLRMFVGKVENHIVDWMVTEIIVENLGNHIADLCVDEAIGKKLVILLVDWNIIV